MKALVPTLGHGLAGEGPWSTVLEVAAFGALLLAAFGLVLLWEDEVEGRTRWAWTALILLVPVLGPLTYLAHRRQTD